VKLTTHLNPAHRWVNYSSFGSQIGIRAVVTQSV
jgi:hypothetical protein